MLSLIFDTLDARVVFSWIIKLGRLAVVVAQLVERSIPTLEIRSWNPDIDKILSTNCIIEKTKIKKKRPIFKKS